MKYVYIENYLKISRDKKKEFLNFMNRSKDFKVSNERIIFSEESVMLGFTKDSDIKKAYGCFKEFFDESKDINVDVVKKSFDKFNHTILTSVYLDKQIRV
jgi:hypothetical protein